MKSIHAVLVFVSVLCAFLGFSASAATKRAPAKSKSTAAKKASGKLAKGRKAPAVPAATWRNRQQAPSSDRFREIQQALVAKGYLKTDPSGVWDSESASAMQRFQSDQKITANGKINSPSLIALGLGAKSAGAAEAAPLPGAPAPVTPPPAASDPPAPAPVAPR